jgi:hypothetical protein
MWKAKWSLVLLSLTLVRINTTVLKTLPSHANLERAICWQLATNKFPLRSRPHHAEQALGRSAGTPSTVGAFASWQW